MSQRATGRGKNAVYGGAASTTTIQYTTLQGAVDIIDSGRLIDDVYISDDSTFTQSYNSTIDFYDRFIGEHSTQATFVPYTFPDTFVMKTNDELSQMSISDIQAYSYLLQGNISSYTSTIRASQEIKAQYVASQNAIKSMLESVDKDIFNNTLQISRVKIASQDLQTASTLYVSTLAGYINSLEYYSDVSSMTQSTLDGYTQESGKLSSTIAIEMSTNASTLSGYSIMTSLYTLYSNQYDSQYNTVMSASSIYTSTVVSEGMKYSTLIDATLAWNSTNTYLSTMYNTSNAIQSTLVQHQIEEVNAIAIHVSTTQATQYYSSLLVAAIAKQNYNFAISTQANTTIAYMNALSTYTGINYIYTTSGGTPTSIVTAARSLAATQMFNANIANGIAASTVSTFDTVSKSQDDMLYNTMMVQYTVNVQAQTARARAFNTYKISSLQQVALFSSIYDTQVAINLSSIDALNYYSSLYISSIVGTSTIQGTFASINRTIIAKMSTSDGYSNNISTLNIDYANYTSSYIGYMNMSSALTSDINGSMLNMNALSSFYDSTIAGISTNSSSSLTLAQRIANNADSIFAESSMLLVDYIALDACNNDILTNTTAQEVAKYKYMETYSRTKRIDYQTSYQNLIFSAIQQSSTQTGSTIAGLMSTVDAGAYVAQTTFPVILDTPIINAAYTKITTIDAFLSVFSDIYDAYDVKVNNISAVSTAIGNEMDAVTIFNNASLLSYTNPSDNTLYQNKMGQLDLFIQSQNNVLSTKNTIQTSANAISSIIGTRFLPIYGSTFTSTEVAQQYSTVSSFIIAGFAVAIAAFAANGINVTF